MSSSAQIGVTGLAVMGRNLARNFARNGYTVAVHNRTAARTHALVEEFGHEGSFVAAETAKEFVAALERPRRLVVMVKAGLQRCARASIAAATRKTMYNQP